MIPGRQYKPTEVLRNILWGRKWTVALTFVVVATATIAVAGRLPDRYQAETVILVQSRNVAQDFVRPTVTTETIGDRLESIKQQILSRTRLEQIIRDLNPYPDARSTSLEVQTEELIGDIDVVPVEGSEAIRVTFDSRSARLAMQVTERLAGLFIEGNLQDRQELVQETSDFLDTQLENARQKLVEQEKRLEAYRLQYGPELPTQLQANMQVIQNSQTQLQMLAEEINRDRDRRLVASRQLAELQATDVERLEAAEGELKALELRLTPRHPDLQRAREEVAALRRAATEGPRPAAPAPAQPQTPTEAARLRRIEDLQLEMASLDQQLAERRRLEAELRGRVKTYQTRVEALPVRESELIAITRDYDTLQSIYRSLLSKQQDSTVAENLEQRQVGEQFKILDPPREPERPVGPDRLLIDAIGGVAGLFIGLAMAGLLELRDARVRVTADVQAAVQVPILATIPKIITPADRRRARVREAFASLAILVVLGTCVTTVWLTFRL